MVACLWFPGRIANNSGVLADVALSDMRYRGGEREAVVNVQVHPAEATAQAAWLHVLSWQGDVRHAQLTKLVRLDDGRYVTDSHVPIDGEWKTMLRLQAGDDILALPIYMPADEAIPAEAIHPVDRERSRLVPDKIVLQREATNRAPWVHRIGSAAMLLLAAIWLAAFARVLFRERQDVGLG